MEKNTNQLSEELSVSFVSYSITGGIGFLVSLFFGSENIVAKIILYVFIFIVGIAILNQKWFYQNSRICIPVLLAFLGLSLAYNIISIYDAYAQNNNGYSTLNDWPIEISIYQGRDDVSGHGAAWLHILNEDNEFINEFAYTLPEDEEIYGYVGLIYRFLQTQDITKYRYIEIEATFESGAVCNLYLVDNDTEKYSILLGNGTIAKNDITVNIKNGKQVIRIPLSYFETINHKSVIQLELVVDTNLSRGTNHIRIHDIRFIE